ncbi:MAG: hypothetical protein MJ252_29290, partial [archaeon]|nr:hypothetical protein [archaeon]
GIGDWAQSPIPNPQSPIKSKLCVIYTLFILIKIVDLINNIFFNLKYLRIKLIYSFSLTINIY